MVVGYMNVGKTSLIDNLFSLSASFEKKRKLLPGYISHELTLLGKTLTEYYQNEKKEYILDENCKVEMQSNDHLLLAIKEKDKEMLYKFSTEKERNIWYERLKRAIRNESTHGIDVSRQEISHTMITQVIQEKEKQF